MHSILVRRGPLGKIHWEIKAWFPKGWFWRMLLRNENRNEGIFGCSPGTTSGTRVRSDVPPERKPERAYVRQNQPCTKLPFYLGESNRPLTPILLKSIAIRLPFLSRYFCKSMPSFWQRVVYTPPIRITIRLPFVSRYFFKSIRVRGRWDTPKLAPSERWKGRGTCPESCSSKSLT